MQCDMEQPSCLFGLCWGVVETSKFLRMFSESPSQARELYRDFVNEGIGVGRDESIYSAVCQQIVGDDRFIERVEEAVGNIKRHLKRHECKPDPMFFTVEFFGAAEWRAGVADTT